MEKRTIGKDMLVDTCPECGQEITGYTDRQVNARMKMHKMKHAEEELKKREENGN